jgi:lysophospholipase L1-like esterase
VTLTVGGNGFDLPGLIAACSTPEPQPSASCLAALAARAALLNPATSPLVGDLATTIQAIHTAAPNATVYVTGYPLLFEPNLADPLALTNQVNGLTLALNGLIKGTVGAVAQNQGTDVVYVDVTTATAFAGHGIGSETPWINFNPADLSDPENFHPNAAGYRAYYAALVSAGAFPAAVLH